MYTIAGLCDLFLQAIANENFTEFTQSNFKRALKRMLNFAEENGYVEFSEEFAEDFVANGGNDKRNIKDPKDAERRRLRIMNLFREQVNEGHISFRVYRKKTLDLDTDYYRQELDKFVAHLQEGGLENTTIMTYRFPVFRMFQYYESLNVIDVDQITVESMPKMFEYLNQFFDQYNGLKNVMTGLRAYARYAERDDLLMFFNTVKPKAKKLIVPCLTEEERDALVKVLYSEKILKRDKAIILLSLTTGIRACDIIAMKFDDIDWRTATISFIQEKTNNPVNDPGLAAVLNAIYDYILNERPKVSFKNIFLRSVAPYRPLTNRAAIYKIIKKACTEAGISFDKRICGTAFLRHNVVTYMLRNDIPQEVIAAVVGHADVNTTSIYISADDEGIAECMLPLIEAGDFSE